MTEQPKAFGPDGVQFAWDQTSIGYAENCLRKYQLIMLEGWKPRTTSAHLIFGGAYASALETYHKLVASGMDRDEATIEVVSKALYDTWEYDEDGTGGHPWISDHNTKTRENLIRTIVWYLDQFADDPCTTVILSDGSAAVEHSFALPVDNDIILTGHLDRLVLYAGDPYVQDQKTTGTTLTSYYFDQYSNDNQMLQYTFAGKAIFGLPVKGVMVDAAQIAVGFTRFARGFTSFSEGSLNEWYDHTLWHIQLAQAATRDNYFPMNRTSCNDYGGCPFRGVCSKSPKVRDNFLRADYERGERWDPLKTR